MPRPVSWAQLRGCVSLLVRTYYVRGLSDVLLLLLFTIIIVLEILLQNEYISLLNRSKIKK